MKKLIISFTLISYVSLAQIPVNYYNSAQGLSGNNLKIALHNIIKNGSVLSYAGLWGAFSNTDKKTNGNVWDIYSFNPSGTQPYEYAFVTNQCGNYNSEGDCYNREHSWPQSWFNSDVNPNSDLFHVYPTDGKVNGVRANYPYGNVGSVSYNSQNGSKLGACINIGYNLTVFEPLNEFKGDLARSYFYMSTRYYSQDAAWTSSDATNKSDILPWQVNVLLQWHQQDPVSTKEIARNNTIYSIQNNRNPFIDNPQWADSIWKTTIIGLQENLKSITKFFIYPNPSTNYFTLKSETNFYDYDLKIYDVFGKLIENTKINSETKINCSQWLQGIYIIVLQNATATNCYKFIKTN